MAKYKRSKSEGKIAHKKTTIDGIEFDSKMESDYYLYLKEEKKKGNVLKFELQPLFVLQPKHFVLGDELVTFDDEDNYKEKDKLRKQWNKQHPDKTINIVNAIKYISDFDVTYKDGSNLIIDVKGLKTADFKIKEKMFAFRNPMLKLECVTWDGPSKAWLLYDDYLKAKKLRAAEAKVKKLEREKTKKDTKKKPKKKPKTKKK